jgi:hypothetical protein
VSVISNREIDVVYSQISECVKWNEYRLCHFQNHIQVKNFRNVHHIGSHLIKRSFHYTSSSWLIIYVNPSPVSNRFLPSTEIIIVKLRAMKTDAQAFTCCIWWYAWELIQMYSWIDKINKEILIESINIWHRLYHRGYCNSAFNDVAHTIPK